MANPTTLTSTSAFNRNEYDSYAYNNTSTQNEYSDLLSQSPAGQASAYIYGTSSTPTSSHPQSTLAFDSPLADPTSTYGPSPSYSGYNSARIANINPFDLSGGNDTSPSDIDDDEGGGAILADEAQDIQFAPRRSLSINLLTDNSETAVPLLPITFEGEETPTPSEPVQASQSVISDDIDATSNPNISGRTAQATAPWKLNPAVQDFIPRSAPENFQAHLGSHPQTFATILPSFEDIEYYDRDMEPQGKRVQGPPISEPERIATPIILPNTILNTPFTPEPYRLLLTILSRPVKAHPLSALRPGSEEQTPRPRRASYIVRREREHYEKKAAEAKAEVQILKMEVNGAELHSEYDGMEEQIENFREHMVGFVIPTKLDFEKGWVKDESDSAQRKWVKGINKFNSMIQSDMLPYLPPFWPDWEGSQARQEEERAEEEDGGSEVRMQEGQCSDFFNAARPRLAEGNPGVKAEHREFSATKQQWNERTKVNYGQRPFTAGPRNGESSAMSQRHNYGHNAHNGGKALLLGQLQSHHEYVSYHEYLIQKGQEIPKPASAHQILGYSSQAPKPVHVGTPPRPASTTTTVQVPGSRGMKLSSPAQRSKTPRQPSQILGSSQSVWRRPSSAASSKPNVSSSRASSGPTGLSQVTTNHSGAEPARSTRPAGAIPIAVPAGLTTPRHQPARNGLPPNIPKGPRSSANPNWRQKDPNSTH